MFDQTITECMIFNPTLERAFKIAPKEFIPAYQWFIDHENSEIDKLPHHLEKGFNVGGISISRDSGIHSPSKDKVTYGLKQYALSVHASNGNGRYVDGDPIFYSDGTWSIEYSEHVKSKGNQIQSTMYNTFLMNCLNDGLPIGLIVNNKKKDKNKKKNKKYKVMGLAFVERYNSATGMFTLHGPVNAKTVNNSSFISAGFDELKPEIQNQLEQIDDTDERIKEFRESMRRQGQAQFRNNLLKAYSNRCAISGNDVPQVLQAAHIGQYRGPKTQMVTNGILLRSDLHLLFDAHLLSVEPDSKRIRLSRLLDKTEYIDFNKKQLHMPVYREAYPNEKQLERHFDQFMAETEILK